MSTNLERLLDIMARLRDPESGCPWDVEQDFSTIAPHTIEEAYEVADAIQRDDMAALVDELGDLLLQVVFHARIAAEAELFDFEAVAGAICDKLVRRHPHVFGEEIVADAAAQTEAWEDHKAGERRDKAASDGFDHGTLDGVAVGLPALTRALKLQKRAARAGFDWRQADEVLQKFAEEIAELKAEMSDGADPTRLADETGDLLFTCVNLARKLGIDPETALRHGNAKFEKRFRHMEAMLAARGQRLDDASFTEKEAAWRHAKRDTAT
jgi:ATP diphosphatase